MTDFYCDHGAYGLASNRIGLDVPTTWGVPQEGDGSSKDAATASSIAEILIKASPTASETIVIAGATITAGAAAAANVFVRGATPSATATNIVTLLNSSNATATLSSSAAVGTPQLRNAVYARVKPGFSDTVQIMFRIGSATLNHATNSTVAISSAGWASAPTITQFAGGSGGCWGWFINPSALGQNSSIALMTYGCMLYTPYVCFQALPTSVDNIYSRTGGGASKEISCVFTGSTTLTKSTAWNPNHVFDTNTKWTGDASDGRVHVAFSCSIYSAVITVKWTASAAAFFNLHALRKGGCKLSWSTSQSTITFICRLNSSYSSVEFCNVEFEDNSTNIETSVEATWVSGDSAAHVTVLCSNCKFSRMVAKPTIYPPFSTGLLGYNSYGDYTFSGCEFYFNVSGAGDPNPLFGNANYWENGTIQILLTGCSFTGREGGFTLYAGSYPKATSTNLVNITVDNCTGIALPAAYWGFPTSTTLSGSVDTHIFNISLPDRQFRYETQRGITEWLAGVSPAFPTLSATTIDGDPWSLRHLWVNGAVSNTRVDKFPPLRLTNRLADAVRTITVQVLMPSDVTLAINTFYCEFSYIDEYGVPRGESIKFLQDSIASWTGAANWPDHEAKKFEITTAYPVKQNTDVTIYLSLRASPSTGTNEYVFVDPEFTIS